VLLLFFASLACATYSGNYALSFDGTDDIVTVPHNYQDYPLDDFWTLEAWIYPTAEQTSRQLNLVGYPGRHPNMNFCGQNNPQCTAGAPLVQLRDAHSGGNNGGWFPLIGDSDKIISDQWHHVAGTWNNVTLSLYIDGVLNKNVTPYTQGYVEAVNCVNSVCEQGLQIGGNYIRDGDVTFKGQYFRGYIDEVRVWTYGRSAHEIQSTMNTGLTGKESGLLYYFRFDDHGSSITHSSAFNLFALLGGGFPDGEPRFIVSTSPVSAPPGTSGDGVPGHVVVEKESAGAVTAGALIGVFCLLGGLAIGIFVGYKAFGKNLFKLFWKGESGEADRLFNEKS